MIINRLRTFALALVAILAIGLTSTARADEGRVRNIFSPGDVAGVYGAGAAGAAVIRGPQVVVLTNQRGAVMELAGTQTGLMVNLDLNGMAVSLR